MTVRLALGTVEHLRRPPCAPGLGALVCSISGLPTSFSWLLDLIFCPCAYPSTILPSHSPGRHNILAVFVFDTQLRHLLPSSRPKAVSHLLIEELGGEAADVETELRALNPQGESGVRNLLGILVIAGG